jgi:hypothetical protein
MTVDYDAPRRAPVDAEEPLNAIVARRNDPATAVLDIDETDIDETDILESYELPGADLSDEELIVSVVPKRDDEFTCRGCFLVHHRNSRARGRPRESICTDCA